MFLLLYSIRLCGCVGLQWCVFVKRLRGCVGLDCVGSSRDGVSDGAGSILICITLGNAASKGRELWEDYENRTVDLTVGQQSSAVTLIKPL